MTRSSRRSRMARVAPAMPAGDVVMRLAVSAEAARVHELREAAAAWQVAHEIVQWSPGEISLSSVVSQIGRGEWWVSTSVGGCVDAAVRLLDRDPSIWGESTGCGFIHGLVVARDATGRHLGSSVLSWAEDQISRRGRRWARLGLRREQQPAPPLLPRPRLRRVRPRRVPCRITLASSHAVREATGT